MRFVAWCLIFIALIMMSSCAGYRIRKKGNPFADEDIKTIGIPMFVNRSSYPGMAGSFTRKISNLMASYPELIIRSDDSHVDAILVGVIEGPRRYAEAYETVATKFTGLELKESIGDRAGFYLPTASTYEVRLRIMLIKNPTTEDRKLLLSKIGDKIKIGPKVLFNQIFTYNQNFNRETKETITPDSGGTVNYTKTRRYFDQSVDQLADRAVRDVEELVLNVF